MNTPVLTTDSRAIPEGSRMTPRGREGKGRDEEGKGIFPFNQVQIVYSVEGQRLDGLVL